jgi:hypothetical protein
MSKKESKGKKLTDDQKEANRSVFSFRVLQNMQLICKKISQQSKVVTDATSLVLKIW